MTGKEKAQKMVAERLRFDNGVTESLNDYSNGKKTKEETVSEIDSMVVVLLNAYDDFCIGHLNIAGNLEDIQ